MWITPTSYGLVITKIEKDLHRIYLDKKASEALIKNPSTIIEYLKSKNIDSKEIGSCINTKDIFKCKNLVRKNNWRLFSLYPLQISVQTVNYCNARCDFCYANIPSEKRKRAIDIDIKKVFELKDYAASKGVKFGISGGEPLLHPYIYDILSYRNKEVFDTLITNLTPSFDMDRLMKTGVDLIQVSLHGLGSFHNSLLGIKDAYEKVRNRIIELMEKLNIATNTVITPYNMESIKPLVEDLVRIQKITDKKFSYVRFIPVLPSGRGYTLYKTTSPFIEKVESLLSRLIEKYDLNFEVPILHPNPYEYFYEGGRWFCPAGSTVAVVRIDGCIIPCNQFLDTNVRSKSSVFDTDFHRIWINDPLLSEMRKGIAGSPNFSCQECRYLIMRTQLL